MMAGMWNPLKGTRWSERRKDGRIPAPDLDVSYATELEQKKVRIKDISATGLYLLTDDRLQPGTEVELTLEKCSIPEVNGLLDPAEDRPQAKVHLRAKAVRLGQGGVGVAFAEDGMDAATWSKLMAVAAELTGAKDQIRLLRMTKALAFVLHISPTAEEELLALITNKLSLEGTERVIEIALNAEEMAAMHEGNIRTDVPASLVLRILEDGSKVDEERTRRNWAVLLANSCYEGAKEDENLNYALLLSKIDSVQMRIFDASCKLAMRTGWEPGFKFRQDLHCGADEIRKITHIQNLMGIERDLNHLHELGLLEQTDRPALCQQVERVNMAPTLLALRLYARCNGRPEPPESLEGAKSQKAS